MVCSQTDTSERKGKKPELNQYCLKGREKRTNPMEQFYNETLSGQETAIAESSEKLKREGSKVALIELVCALQYQGVFDKGNNEIESYVWY